MNCSNIDPIDLAVLTSALAITIAKGNSANENNVIGNLLVAAGGLILEIAAQQANLESNITNTGNTNNTNNTNSTNNTDSTNNANTKNNPNSHSSVTKNNTGVVH